MVELEIFGGYELGRTRLVLQSNKLKVGLDSKSFNTIIVNCLFGKISRIAIDLTALGGGGGLQSQRLLCTTLNITHSGVHRLHNVHPLVVDYTMSTLWSLEKGVG